VTHRPFNRIIREKVRREEVDSTNKFDTPR
jgi:hypothetical protein